MSTVILQDNFVANLTAAMARLGMSQQDLAAASGVHFVTINRILRGHNEPKFDICEKLAKAVGIDPPKIFSHPRRNSG